MKRLALLPCVVLAALALATPVSSFAKTVVIDAGHGGIDRGGISRQTFPEKVQVLDIAQRLQSKLRAAGYKTVMTRSGDYFVPLPQRCAIANCQKNAIFVSVHTNSDPRGSGIGIETYYYSGAKSAKLASSIHREVVCAAGTPDRHVRSRRFYVLRKTRIPAVLVEVGFLTNAIEGKRIASSASYRDRLASAIARGIRSAY